MRAIIISGGGVCQSGGYGQGVSTSETVPAASLPPYPEGDFRLSPRPATEMLGHLGKAPKTASDASKRPEMGQFGRVGRIGRSFPDLIFGAVAGNEKEDWE
jgi:hypothetical protein